MITVLALAAALGLASAVDPRDAAPRAMSLDAGQARWQLDRALRRWISLGRPRERQRLRVQFVRADVEIRPSASGQMEIWIESAAPVVELARIVIGVNWSEEEIGMLDLFPQRSSWTNECLPPPDERGDFWIVSARLKVVLRLPGTMDVRVQVREGQVRDLRYAEGT